MPMKCTFSSLFNRTIVFFVICLSTAGCAHFSFSPSLSKNQSIAIPMVLEDETGDMTQSLTQAIATKTHLRVSPDSRFKLVVKILDLKKERLAYRWKKDSAQVKRTNNDKESLLIPTENRANILARVEIIDTVKHETIRGPGFIRASIDYDFQHHAKNHNVTRYSLGQVQDTEADQDALPLPVYRALASNIALWVQQQVDLLPFESPS